MLAPRASASGTMGATLPGVACGGLEEGLT